MKQLGHADTMELTGKTIVTSYILWLLNWGKRCETIFEVNLTNVPFCNFGYYSLPLFKTEFRGKSQTNPKFRYPHGDIKIQLTGVNTHNPWT